MWYLKNILIIILISIVLSKRILSNNNFHKDTVVLNLIKSLQCSANNLIINKNLSIILHQSQLILTGKIVQKKLIVHHYVKKVFELKVLIKRILKNDIYFNKKFINLIFLFDEQDNQCDSGSFFMKKIAIFVINISSVDTKYPYILSINPVPFSLHNLDIINFILNDNAIKIREFEPEELCDKKHCNHGASCIMINNKTDALCKCPDDCSTDYEPICGTNSKTYVNYCYLRADSCNLQKKIRIKHFGECELRRKSLCTEDGNCDCFMNCLNYKDELVCGSNGQDYRNECELQQDKCLLQTNLTVLFKGKCDPCSNVTCSESKICQLNSDRIAQCNCGEHCPLEFDPICASDGHTYQNDCILRQESCRLRKKLHIIYRGKCSSGLNPCDLVKCEVDEECIINKYGVANCECSKNCEQIVKPICSNNGLSFLNECEFIQYRCKNKLDLKIAYFSECNKKHVCNSMQCAYGSICVEQNNQAECHCRNCTNLLNPVCGSDGISYENECKLSRNSCLKQVDIYVSHKGYCDSISYICNDRQLVNNNLGDRIECLNDPKCFNNKYCLDLEYSSVCCPTINIVDNSQNMYICNNTNCIEMCDCNMFGSYSPNCHLITKQCFCKFGVIGLKCDRCAFGYWGFQDDNVGCKKCACSKFGSLREDCDQITGQCFCKLGVHGHKCTMCIDHQKKLGPNGCYSDLYNDESQNQLSHMYENKMPLTKSTRHLIEPNYRYFYKRTNNFISKIANYSYLGDLCYKDNDCPILFSFCFDGTCQCLNGYESFNKQECKLTNYDNNCTIENSNTCKAEMVMKSIKSPVFQGKSFLKLRPLNARSKFSLEIELKTYDNNGIIFYSEKNSNVFKTFISLALINGFIEFRYNLGDDLVILRSNDALEFNKFTTIIIKRYHKDGLLKVLPNQAIAGRSKGDLKFFDTLNETYIGFVPINLQNIYDFNIGTRKGFQGCIKRLKINDKLVNFDSNEVILNKYQISDCYEQNPCLSRPCFNNASCEFINLNDFRCVCDSKYVGKFCEQKIDSCLKNDCYAGSTCVTLNIDDYVCSCPLGKFGNRCENERSDDIKTNQIIPKFLNNSFIKIKTEFSIHRNFFMEIWFKSYINDGVIFFNTQKTNNRILFIIYINNGFIHFEFEYGHHFYNIKSSNPIIKNEWQKIFIAILENEIILNLENSISKLQLPDSFYLNVKIRNFSFIGKLPTRFDYHRNKMNRKSFSGAIQRISINGLPLPILRKISICNKRNKIHNENYCKSKEIVMYDDIDGPCSIMDNHCLNFGLCIPNFKDYFCNCMVNYTGKNCETSINNFHNSNVINMNDRALSFNGKTFLLYNYSDNKRPKRERKNQLELTIKTNVLNGLIFWRGKSKFIGNEFISIAISNGFPEFSFKMKNQKKITFIRSRVNVSDGNWHMIQIKRMKRICTIQVDSEFPVKMRFKIFMSKYLSVSRKFWLGGYKYLPSNLPKNYYIGFKGCLRELILNLEAIDLYELSKRNKLKLC